MSDTGTRLRPLEIEADDVTFFRRRVAPDLSPWVEQIVGYRETGTRLDNAIEMAPLVVPLILSFAEPFEIALGRRPAPDERYGSFASGLYPGHVVMNSTGRSQCVQVDFTPLGASRFFGFPVGEFAARMVHLSDIADPQVAQLRSMLAETSSWPLRLDIAESFLRQRLLTGPAPSAELAFAWSAILQRAGRVRIAAIADRIGWSRKHLTMRFIAEFGVAPKTIARMARFNRAVALAAATPSSLADIAADAGYADQAHFTREFQEFGGQSPGAWRTASPQALG